MCIKKITDAIARILLFQPAFGYITSGWKIEESDMVPTMGTDYKRLLYNSRFVEGLSMPDLRGVVLHEIVHCLFLHPTEITRIQSEGKNKDRWTKALEVVTNAAVKDLMGGIGDISLPGEPVSPIKPKDIVPGNSYYYYDVVGHSHTAPEIYDMIPEDISMSSLSSGFNTNGDDDGQLSTILADDIIQADKTDNIEAVEKSIAVLKKIQIQKGNLPTGLERLLSKLTDGRIPWNKVLQSFVSTVIRGGAEDISWSVPNTRHPLADKIILPGNSDTEIDPVTVVIDTSGSISEKQITQFVSEVAKLISYTQEITVYTTDAKVHETVKVRSVPELLKNVKFKGYGGTDFTDVFEKINKNTSCVVFFTDGMATYPSKHPNYPVLWVLTKHNNIPPFGKVTYILDE